MLAFGVASVQDLGVVAMLIILAFLGIAFERPTHAFVRSLRVPVLLATGLIVIAPLFGTGPHLLQIGPFSYDTDTANTAVLMAGRVLAIAAIMQALLAGLSDLQLVSGLRGLRVPALICDLALLTLRYLHDLRVELQRARLARDIRGGAGGWHGLTEFGALLAVLMIRSLQRSERVWTAMRVRGYQSGLVAAPPPLTARDLAAIIGAGLVAAVLIGVSL
jgi:cobalt/nickel transport system permease protein